RRGRLVRQGIHPRAGGADALRAGRRPQPGEGNFAKITIRAGLLNGRAAGIVLGPDRSNPRRASVLRIAADSRPLRPSVLARALHNPVRGIVRSRRTIRRDRQRRNTNAVKLRHLLKSRRGWVIYSSRGLSLEP